MPWLDKEHKDTLLIVITTIVSCVLLFQIFEKLNALEAEAQGAKPKTSQTSP